MMTFSDYWEENKRMLMDAGVTEVVAHKIWGDAVDAFANGLRDKLNL